MAARGLQVVTLNVWGLPDLPFKKLSPFREQRIRAVCAELLAQSADPHGWDVVLIQEAWLKKDRAALKASGFPYVIDLDGWFKWLDSGLLILSRHPVTRGSLHRLRFSKGGHLGKSFEDGEFFAAKSGILGQIEHPELGGIWVANTHLIAQYPGQDDIYLNARKEQLGELVEWIAWRCSRAPVIVGGDLNFGPGSEEWELLTSLMPGFSQAPNAADIFTLDRSCPSQAARFEIAGGHKVDHILASPHFHATHGRLAFDEHVDIAGRPMRVSDHFGLHTRFELKQEQSDVFPWAALKKSPAPLRESASLPQFTPAG